MSRMFILSVEADDSWRFLADEEVCRMLKVNEEGHGIKVAIVSKIDEAGIMDLLLKHGDLLTCFNCGKKLTEVNSKRMYERTNEKLVAKLVLEPGETNYQHEPDLPASLYFVCAACTEAEEQKKC